MEATNRNVSTVNEVLDLLEKILIRYLDYKEFTHLHFINENSSNEDFAFSRLSDKDLINLNMLIHHLKSFLLSIKEDIPQNSLLNNRLLDLDSKFDLFFEKHFNEDIYYLEYLYIDYAIANLKKLLIQEVNNDRINNYFFALIDQELKRPPKKSKSIFLSNHQEIYDIIKTYFDSTDHERLRSFIETGQNSVAPFIFSGSAVQLADIFWQLYNLKLMNGNKKYIRQCIIENFYFTFKNNPKKLDEKTFENYFSANERPGKNNLFTIRLEKQKLILKDE